MYKLWVNLRNHVLGNTTTVLSYVRSCCDSSSLDKSHKVESRRLSPVRDSEVSRHKCTALISCKVAVLNVDVATMCIIPLMWPRARPKHQHSSSLCCTKHTVFGEWGRLEPESFPPIPSLLRCTLLHLQPTPPKKTGLFCCLPSSLFGINARFWGIVLTLLVSVNILP